MSEVMSKKPELTYDELKPDREFEPYQMVVDDTAVSKFLATIEDENPIYRNASAAKEWGYNRALAPHSLAAVYARASYLKNYTMPGGGILVKQDFHFFRPIQIGDHLVCKAKVVERFEKKGRKYVVIETSTSNQNRELVSRVKIEAIWPK
jgi:3-hydroxybutyryl-CoA dehydratase